MIGNFWPRKNKEYEEKYGKHDILFWAAVSMAIIAILLFLTILWPLILSSLWRP